MKNLVLFIAICLISNVAMTFENDRPVFSSQENVPELNNYLNADHEGENDADREAEESDDEEQVTEDGVGSSLGKVFQDSVTSCSIM
ncbi:MAG: hypothetical protein Q8S31_07375 [Alphaproteobacteria bacterium]|nr:hypothetical protein [Alphaproteobacteria bacterium]